MPSQRRLVIDIGTNSVLALLADVSGNKLSVISDLKKTTKLGEGLLNSGLLSNEGMTRTASAIVEFLKNASCDQVVLLGTEALRIADNEDLFIARIRDLTAHDVLVLSGPNEAELSFLGAMYGFDIDKSNVLHIDVGGGSTEITAAVNGRISKSISIPIGALSLKEMFPHDSLENYQETANKIIAPYLTDFSMAEPHLIISTGGTITSIAAIAAGLVEFQASAIRGMVLSIGEVKEIARRFENVGLADQKRLVPFDQERADIILPGAGIFAAILGIISTESIMVSTGGVRFGAALYPEKICS